jgi:hypothetical protein
MNKRRRYLAKRRRQRPRSVAVNIARLVGEMRRRAWWTQRTRGDARGESTLKVVPVCGDIPLATYDVYALDGAVTRYETIGYWDPQ